MKKLLIILSSLFLVIGVQAQDDPDKMLKKATRLVGAYNLSPADNVDKLMEAKDLLDKAMSGGTLNESPKAQLAKGQIYNEIMLSDIKKLTLNPDMKFENPQAGLKGYEGFKNALKYAEKGYEKKDAIKGLNGILGNVNYIGSIMYQRQEFVNAYEAFSATLEGHELLKANGEEGQFADQEELHGQMYFAGVAALSAEKESEAKEIFTALYDEGFEEPGLYEALYKLNKDTDKAKAVEIMNAGREKHPDDVGLLYSEINHYLSEGQLDVLIDKLKLALDKEPDNLSVMTTLGNVYDQLYQKASAEEGQEAAADEYFNNALKYYDLALGKNPEYFDATYSIGALYYNKAATLTQVMNSLSEDYSKDGTAKYEKAKTAVTEMFDKALPYFTKAEELNANDLNTLIALKEIHARANDFEKSNAYKERIDALSGSGE